MPVLLLIFVVLAVALAVGWRMIAAETSPRTANGVLVLVGGLGAAAWLWSQASFAAGF